MWLPYRCVSDAAADLVNLPIQGDGRPERAGMLLSGEWLNVCVASVAATNAQNANGRPRLVIVISPPCFSSSSSMPTHFELNSVRLTLRYFIFRA
jgi:hypothetical protein